MNIKILFCLAFLCLFNSLWAQDLPTTNTNESDLAAWYKITDEEAGQILTWEKRLEEKSLQHTFLGIYPLKNAAPKSDTLKGYYLKIYAEKEDLKIEMATYHSISAQILNHQKGFSIRVLDSMGNLLPTAVVSLNNKNIPFNKATQTHLFPKRKKRVFLTIKALGETIFYEVEKEESYDYYKPFFQTKIGKVVKAPYTFTKRTWRKLKRLPRNLFSRKYKTYQGYIACNQPKYQPFDTLKAKAFITNKNGKPLTKTLEARLEEYYRGKTIWKKEVKPDLKGNYVVEVPLGDTLQLDRHYEIAFYEIQKNGVESRAMVQSFDFEDYELDAIDYTFKTNKDKYTFGDSIELHFSAKYKTGLYVPDARVKLVARTKVRDIHSNVSDFRADEVLVKDTLWTYEQNLNASDTTLIYFPTAVLPKAAINRIWIEAEFTDSSGELQGASARFAVEQVAESCLQMRLEGEYVVAECVKEDKSIAQKVIFQKEGNYGRVESEYEVTLPYRERLNPSISDYQIHSKNGEDRAILDFFGNSSNVEVNGNRQNDSIYVLFQNPRQIPIYYNIYEGKKLVGRGQTEQAQFVWKRKDRNKEVYFLQYSHSWNGEDFNETVRYDFPENQLDITIEQAPNVRPGDKVNVKVSVKNRQQKSAAGVNLVAGAINGQFDELDNFGGPYLKQKRYSNLKKKKDMEVDNWSQRSQKETINKDWYKKLQLDEKRYYQLRFPQKGVFMQTDSIEGIAAQDTFYRDIAQFAPHLVKDGKEQPIYLIYCNQDLVYYYEANPQSPYSFVGLEGYNQITIRGRDFSYTMDSVLLKKGHKLTFSIDENRYSMSEYSSNIHRIAVENQFSKTELRLLKQRIFQLRTEAKGINYVFQDKYLIHPLQTGNNYNGKTWQFGPFSSKRDLTLIRQDAFENTFLFESGFKYEIAENRERLYKSKYFDEAFPLPKKIADKALGESIFHPHHIIAQSPGVLPTIQYDSQNHSTQAENGLYYFEYRMPRNNENELMAVVLMANDTTRYIYGGRARYLQNLTPNDYQLLLIKQNGGYLQKNFRIEANALTFQRIDSTANFWADSSLQMFNKVLQQRFKKDVPMVVPKSNGENLSIGENGISGIRGYVMDKETLETLPFVNVAVNVGGHLVGTTTDFDGYYELHLRAGRYSLTYSYVGYQTKKIEGIAVSGYNYTNMNVELNTSSEVLAIVQVVSYSVPLLEQKIRAISSLDGILTGSASGVSKTIISAGERPEDSYELPDYMDGNDLLQNREEPTEYFIDGIKVTGLNQLQFEENRQQLRSNFSDYAYWQPNLLTDQNGEAYFTVTFPDNTTEWKTFVLGMNAKQQGGFASTTTNAYKDIMAQLSVPRFLIEGDETNVLGKSLNYTGDSIQIQTQFKMEEDVLQSNTANIKEVLVEKAEITAPSAAKQDSVNLTYSLQLEDGYGDGEKRQIPILKKGIEETVGDFYSLKKDTSIRLSFNENLGEVHLYAENSVLDLLQKDLDYLQNYPYGCNEQNASRLMALLMDKEIKQQLGQAFGKEKVLRTTLKKIEKARNEDGSWGWWRGNSFNLWMTLYVSKALKKVESDEWTPRLLVNRLPQLEGRNLLMVLLHFAEIGLNTDFEKYLQKADSTMVKPQLNDQLQILKIRQLWKLPHDLQLLDSLRQSTTFGNYYWGEKGHGWHDNAIQNTLLAFDIYQRANRTEDCQKIIGYFLERRGRSSWRNTFETAQILQAILPTLLKESGGELEENKLVLSGAFDQTITEFPFEAKLSTNKPLNIQKTGSTPIYFTTYQSFWNPKPKAKSDIFAVQTSWQNADNELVKTLKAAEKATLKVDIEVKESAEYVMIEVPIPAACSYGNKGKNSSPYEVHREYFKERVAIFCENLPVGKHRFEVPLEARYTGTYTVNSAKVEQMYFPVFYGRNELKEVEVE